MQTLLHDEFTDLPVAVIAGDYTPSGEYHVVPELADSGRWREVTIHHSYRRVSTSRGNWQVVEENDGSAASSRRSSTSTTRRCWLRVTRPGWCSGSA